MKKLFERPMMEVSNFTVVDVITTSIVKGDDETNDDEL